MERQKASETPFGAAIVLMGWDRARREVEEAEEEGGGCLLAVGRAVLEHAKQRVKDGGSGEGRRARLVPVGVAGAADEAASADRVDARRRGEGASQDQRRTRC